MKKTLAILSAILISFSSVSATEEVKKPDLSKQSVQINIKTQRENAFEKRLGLTDEQKVKAREIRIKGHEKIKPVIDEIKAKKQEAKMVKMSRIAVQVQEERLAVIDAELKVLEKKAHDIRKANMKEFESILTRDQKKILKQMKKEGRKKYQAGHPSQRPMLIPSNLKK
jgi:Spy/CpxP family protein refolding chaperone